MVAERDAQYGRIIAAIERAVADPSLDDAAKFGRVTDILVRGRAALLAQILIDRSGAVVHTGPFAGMRFHARASEGCYVPKLLGWYEHELHPVLAELAVTPYDRVIDIGCAEGYYAVGLAKLFPSARIYGFDISPQAREMCRELARMNGVADRVQVDGALTSDRFADLIAGRTLMFCDCEGCEYDLLDPVAAPALRAADLIVEMHDVASERGKLSAFLDRFSDSHDVRLIGQGARDPSTIPAIRDWRHLDQLLCAWEFRAEPTPWAVLKMKTGDA